jgi:hypothetical protein
MEFSKNILKNHLILATTYLSIMYKSPAPCKTMITRDMKILISGIWIQIEKYHDLLYSMTIPKVLSLKDYHKSIYDSYIGTINSEHLICTLVNRLMIV